ncbi:rab proteins geranylgeranyltransferase component A 1 isoform X1 [Sphaeramia orbicularis]|uniref:Rab proteins geranylgeranyltransferase component A n=1 Tax=Sphaeramia orbicularis TaxID=375764 RepID=A0A673BUJ0_9TELE|nr:rab proteins geranylgeranyltransferase component A 1-like isoform X1 [Sphaeramia orbicularis]XP_030010103.1 rab proteins geranylgeranyltransferase component A 1-like isoform X1 [Sphaeramia orbicularis]
MAAEDLPSEFDVIILGTGLCESVVAAACSRVGQRVLHLDRQSYYASNWASFTFNGLLTWIQEQQAESQPDEVQDWSGQVEEGEDLIYLSQSDSSSISNLQVFCYTSEEDEEDDTPNTTEEEKGGGASEATEAADSNKEDEEETEKQEAEEQVAQDEGAEPEADQPCPSADPNQSEPVKKKKISLAQLVKEGRRFNIDLVSKLMYSRGSLVDLLIKSNVSRYAEFKNVSRILTYRQGKVEQVPCSRADVFASRQLSVIEKRKLMRFLTSCVEETEDQQAYNGRPYLEFLSDQQLGENLQHFLLYSIAMATEDTPTEVGLASTRHFLRCLGRYGNTPFLFPVYGLGEIPQCFCRMCAVFGGIYCLRHSVRCLLVDKDTNRCKAVIDSRGQRISCNHFVVEEGYVDAERKQTATPTRCVSRAVLITDGSVLPSDSDQQVSMVTIPPVEAELPSVRMVELCSSTMTCMPGTYLVHLTCQSVGSAYEDLSPLVTRMFHTTESSDQEERPSVLWCLYFNMVDGSGLEVEGHDLPSNMYLCSGPDGALGHDHTIKQAELIFQKILPEEDFCPPAPNPEDIIYDGENGNGNSAEGEELKDDELKDDEEPKEQEEELTEQEKEIKEQEEEIKEQEEEKEEEQGLESEKGQGLETEE